MRFFSCFAMIFFSSALDIDECLLDPSSCDAKASCTNSRGSYSCDCKRGFTGNGTACQGMLNILRFGCFCRFSQCKWSKVKKNPWFLSLDIDECSADPSQCDVNANCINNDGSYLCTCLQGFTGNGTICEGRFIYS